MSAFMGHFFFFFFLLEKHFKIIYPWFYNSDNASLRDCCGMNKSKSLVCLLCPEIRTCDEKMNVKHLLLNELLELHFTKPAKPKCSVEPHTLCFPCCHLHCAVAKIQRDGEQL